MPKSKTLCRGCRDDFYNQFGECWSYAKATTCRRAFVHVSMIPPWNVRLVTTLNCHHRDQYIAVDPSHPQLTKDRKHVQKYDGGDY